MTREVEGDLFEFIGCSRPDTELSFAAVEKSGDLLWIIDEGEVLIDFTTSLNHESVERQAQPQRLVEQYRVDTTARPLPNTAGLRVKAGGHTLN